MVGIANTETNQNNKTKTSYPPTRKIVLGLTVFSALSGIVSKRIFTTTNETITQNEHQNLVSVEGPRDTDIEWNQSLAPLYTLYQNLTTTNLNLNFLPDEKKQVSSTKKIEDNEEYNHEKIETKYVCYTTEKGSIIYVDGKIVDKRSVHYPRYNPRIILHPFSSSLEYRISYTGYYKNEKHSTEAQSRFTATFDTNPLYSRKGYVSNACSPNKFEEALKQLARFGYSVHDHEWKRYPSYEVIEKEENGNKYRFVHEYLTEKDSFTFGIMPIKFYYNELTTITINKSINKLDGDGLQLTLKCGKNDCSSFFKISNAGLHTKELTNEYLNEDTLTLTRTSTKIHSSIIEMTYFLDDVIEITATLEADIQEYIKNANKNQYIVTPSGIHYFDYQSKTLKALEFLPEKLTANLFREYSSDMDQAKKATMTDLKLIESYTGYIPLHVTRTEKIFVPNDITQEEARLFITNNVSAFIKSFMNSVASASLIYNVTMPTVFSDFNPLLENKPSEINKDFIAGASNIKGTLQNFMLLMLGAGVIVSAMTCKQKLRNPNLRFFKQGSNTESETTENLLKSEKPLESKNLAGPMDSVEAVSQAEVMNLVAEEEAVGPSFD